jgi:hypothetical protein
VRITLALVAVALAAAACSGSDPEPGPVPPTATAPSTSAPTTSPPSPTASPTPAPPTLPAAARADTPAGAESFARFWLQSLDYAYKTGNTQPLRALGNCTACAALATGIENFYKGGGESEGGDFKTDSSHIVRHVVNSAALVNLIYSRSSRVISSSGGSPTTTPSESGVELLLTLKRAPDRWLITRVQTVRR